MKSKKRENPNKRLEQLRESIISLEAIISSVHEINGLLKLMLRANQNEFDKLQKRICPKCGLIHSPYSFNKHKAE